MVRMVLNYSYYRYSVDDSRVIRVDEATVLKAEAYLLFYKQVK